MRWDSFLIEIQQKKKKKEMGQITKKKFRNIDLLRMVLR